MKRRTFIKGAVSAAVAASIPSGDGVELYSIAHPIHPDVVKYTHKTYAIATEGMDGARMAAALARSMTQTKEIVSANVFNKAFGE
jgi:hypothetical protein